MSYKCVYSLKNSSESKIYLASSILSFKKYSRYVFTSVSEIPF
jgi:hypothetical protein